MSNEWGPADISNVPLSRKEPSRKEITFYSDRYLIESSSAINIFKFKDITSISKSTAFYTEIIAKYKEWLRGDRV